MLCCHASWRFVPENAFERQSVQDLPARQPRRFARPRSESRRTSGRNIAVAENRRQGRQGGLRFHRKNWAGNVSLLAEKGGMICKKAAIMGNDNSAHPGALIGGGTASAQRGRD
jgi:hypothetical protein